MHGGYPCGTGRHLHGSARDRYPNLRGREVLIRDFLMEVASNYDAHASLSTEVQLMLRKADEHLKEHVPTTINIKGSGGKGYPTFTPWIGFFDASETDSPQHGIYVVYIFAGDLNSVTLGLLQGITQLSEEIGWKEAAMRLSEHATIIRGKMRLPNASGLADSMTLGRRGKRQLGYQAATIWALRYETKNLPDEATLEADLRRFLGLYREAIRVERQLPVGAAALDVPSSN